MKFRLIPAILIGITLTIVTSRIVYFAFTPKYGPVIFSRQGFHRMFDHDVFKYRVLSQYMLLGLDDWMSRHLEPKTTKRRILAQAKDGSEQFYYAFYYLNTFFLCLTAIVTVLLLRLGSIFTLSDAEKYLLLYLSILVINLSQFVVSPYDVSSYFFQLLILYVFLLFIDKDYYSALFAISTLIFLSTLNRESSALSVSALSLLLIQKFGLVKKSIIGLVFITGSFLVTYIALRYMITDPLDVHFKYQNAGNLLVDTNTIGLLFWVAFFSLSIGIARSLENRWMVIAFHLISLPYIVVCFQSGVLWEVRLYMPLFLSSIYLSKLNVSGFRIHLTNLPAKYRFAKPARHIHPDTKIPV